MKLFIPSHSAGRRLYCYLTHTTRAAQRCGTRRSAVAQQSRRRGAAVRGDTKQQVGNRSVTVRQSQRHQNKDGRANTPRHLPWSYRVTPGPALAGGGRCLVKPSHAEGELLSADPVIHPNVEATHRIKTRSLTRRSVPATFLSTSFSDRPRNLPSPQV